ncbi:MAG: radical SAM protein [Sulfolobales archaeon]
MNSSGVLRKAILYKRIDEDIIQCLVCERRCMMRNGSTGICKNYANINNELYHLGYGALSAVESRPIEIKPLYHYWPNSTSLTFSGYACNFYCPWCQNHHISFVRTIPQNKEIIPPEKLVKLAIESGDEGLCASFNEPATIFDYLIDVFSLGRKRGLYSTIVTNGYLTQRAIDMLVESGVDGWSIDIKGCPMMRRALASIDHEIIFRNARRILDQGGHVEMVYLVVTNTNDFEECYKWIIYKHVEILGENIPLHVNRYYPANYWKELSTPVEKLYRIAEEARRNGVEYVYIGNIGDPELETTRCPKCGKILVRRFMYRVVYFRLDRTGGEYRCPRCGYKIYMRGAYIDKH